ncbi:MAG: hypothetical protein ACQESW_10050 [Bacteroidota bacterium]
MQPKKLWQRRKLKRFILACFYYTGRRPVQWLAALSGADNTPTM